MRIVKEASKNVSDVRMQMHASGRLEGEGNARLLARAVVDNLSGGSSSLVYHMSD